VSTYQKEIIIHTHKITHTAMTTLSTAAQKLISQEDVFGINCIIEQFSIEQQNIFSMVGITSKTIIEKKDVKSLETLLQSLNPDILNIILKVI
jgi:hypothetical protein